ncbi:RNA polymerase sigma factor [Pseudalkalibacillus salsuginis]|uniref:RNA polymerase sigma factor n=1 Tax=Pseudalkalibacillus salsuginis TaxID=2910972 RepID=UPI001F3AECE6|nr:RNA polymerase sigma factor [Pseudalkalibacillus salsuginis]MCF6408325.1 RNA polymerase sigma factor [Pseudalkalibacillus salsuginis]
MQRQEIDLNLIYEMFKHKVFKVAVMITHDKYLAEDIVQETFIKAFKKIDSILDIEKIGSWLSTIASRTAIDLIRKEKRSGTILVEDVIYSVNEHAQEKNAVEQIVERVWMEREIEQKVAQLKPALRDAFLLKYEDGLKEEEISKRLQLPIGTVKSRLYRARQQIKTELNKQISA